MVKHVQLTTTVLLNDGKHVQLTKKVILPAVVSKTWKWRESWREIRCLLWSEFW